MLGARDRQHPRADDEPLQRKSRVQLPTPQFRPAPLPHDEGDERQRRHQPPGRALGHESDRGAEVHQRVARRFASAGGRAVAAPCAQQCECAAGQQAGVGREPGAHAKRRQCARGDQCREQRGRGIGLHRQRQRAHRQRGDRRVQQVGGACAGRGITEQGNGSPRHPVRQRRFLEERRAGELRQCVVALLAHAPGDVGLARLIGCPQAAAKHARQPQRRQRQHDEHTQRTRRQQWTRRRNQQPPKGRPSSGQLCVRQARESSARSCAPGGRDRRTSA